MGRHVQPQPRLRHAVDPSGGSTDSYPLAIGHREADNCITDCLLEHPCASGFATVEQLLVRQRTMASNAIRGHLAELGIISAKGRNGMASCCGSS
jgi:hypothetical protein